MNYCLISVCRRRAASELPPALSGTEDLHRLEEPSDCHRSSPALRSCTDQVWQRRVGGGLGAVREEERFVALHHHPRRRRAHAAHHRHLHLLLQVS